MRIRISLFDFLLQNNYGTKLVIRTFSMNKYLLGLTFLCLLTGCSVSTTNLPSVIPESSSPTGITAYSPTPWPLPTASQQKAVCEEYFADLKAELSSVVEPFENCLKSNNFAFKKFLIPNSINDYYGYVGSNSPRLNVDPSCLMDPETSHGCLLYKVVKGKPSIISSQSFPTDDFNDGKGPLLQSTLVGVKSDGLLIFYSTPYEICFSHSYGTMDFTRNRFKEWIPYIVYFGSSGCGDENGLMLYPQDSEKVEILLEQVDQPVPMIRFTHDGKLIGEIKVKNTDLLSWNSGDFPNNNDLKAYALQTDRSKFHFVIEGKKYTIDLTSSTPSFL